MWELFIWKNKSSIKSQTCKEGITSVTFNNNNIQTTLKLGQILLHVKNNVLFYDTPTVKQKHNNKTKTLKINMDCS